MSTPASHNINNWHWTEKNFNEWAIPKIKEILKFKESTDGGEYEVTVENVKGDVFKYVRKNKVHMSYDVKCELKLTFNTVGGSKIEATIVFEPFCDVEDDEWDFELKIQSKDAKPEDIVTVKKSVVKAPFIGRFKTFIDEFKL